MRLRLFAAVFVALTLNAFAAEPSQPSTSTPAVDSENFAARMETLIASEEKIQTALLALKGEGAMPHEDFKSFTAKQRELVDSIDRILALFAEPGAETALAESVRPRRLELNPEAWRIQRRIWAADHKINLILESHWDEWHAATWPPAEEPPWRTEMKGLSNEVQVAKKDYVALNASSGGGANSPKPSLQDQESEADSGTRFPSPDGRYGLLVTKDPEGESYKDRVELIEVATKHSLVLLSDPENVGDRSEDARLDWSADSQRVAAYIGGRRGGITQIFVREGVRFAEVKLPKFPDLPELEKPSPAFVKKHKFKFLKWINTGSLEFVHWLKSGDVEVQSYNEVETVGGGVFRAQINATVVIDSKGRATLKNVVKKEEFE